MAHHKHAIVIVGGGTAGLSVAAILRNQHGVTDIAILEPSTKHYYQPLWTLVGGGVFPAEVTEREEADYIPEDTTWIRERVTSFEPDEHQVTLANGDTVAYEQLVVAPGIQLDWGKVDGLVDALGKGGVCSNYTFEGAPYTWETLRSLTGGNAVFTFPEGPIKCAGAPQKIMWLADHWLRKQGLRDKSTVSFVSGHDAIFGVEHYRRTLDRLATERDIVQRYRHNLVAIRPQSREAVFRQLDTDSEHIEPYDMIHVVPPQSAPDFVKTSPLANNEGWVDVDMYTTQHVRYPDVFSLGDASSLPNSKTGAAVRKQAPVLVANLLAVRAEQEPTARYDGYASCPLVTGYGRLILAEFGYDGKVMETMPFDQSQERYSMWALKAHALPRMYWHGMLRGRW